MSEPSVRAFPYTEESARLFGALAHESWAVFLDSGHPLSDAGRFDILTANPRTMLVTCGKSTEIREVGEIRVSLDDPFTLLRETLGPRTKGCAGLPFCGGAIGYFGYDLGRRLERLPAIAEDLEDLPEMAVGIYDWALVVDHVRRRSWFVDHDFPRNERYLERLQRALSDSGVQRQGNRYLVSGKVSSNLTHAEYLAAVDRIKHYIREGDCYQVNFAQRFSAAARGDPWHAYNRLRRLNPAPFGAFLSTPYCKVLSSSPERFLQVRQGRVETKPIKGTAPRGKDPNEDRRLAEALRNSGKNQAENLMIVDLLRNDLGKVCALGSIEVPELFSLESFARVHHLVSRVRGELAQGEDALSLLRACFPGGSITGAPKLRAMEIIEELEPHRRGIYCGAIGYIGYNGDMDSNIAIRTLVHANGSARLWAGGGIVFDSDPESEYRETYHKASALLDMLQQMSARSDG